ncbi:hypothetical protein SAMN05421684_0154 [Asanoa ishikariensis]|uniref:Uncharacterized protein n=1 Tax=Asanoa ishikariensis TaxID=137265 RepID=A0A1H3KHS5_9ACTN|nr:hypothetical protein SAMN05421684_0154 [Asanoa ishikariensis]
MAPQQRGGAKSQTQEETPDAEHEQPSAAAQDAPAAANGTMSAEVVPAENDDAAKPAAESDAAKLAAESDAAKLAAERDAATEAPKAKSRRWWPFRRSTREVAATASAAAPPAATKDPEQTSDTSTEAKSDAALQAADADSSGTSSDSGATGRDLDAGASGRHAAESDGVDKGTANKADGERPGRHAADVGEAAKTATEVDSGKTDKDAAAKGKPASGATGTAVAEKDASGKPAGDATATAIAEKDADGKPAGTATRTAVAEKDAEGKPAGSATGTAIAEKDAGGATGTAVAEKDADDAGREPDRWAEFAGRTEPPPNVAVRVGRRVGRFLRHEFTLAALISMAAAVVMTWPTLRYPRHTIPQDIWDPTLQAWQMSWSGHSLLTDPGRIWHSNAFYPELWTFAFSDSLLGYAPLGMIGEGPVAAVVRYNIVFVLAHALAAFGAYMLVRQLGAGRTGSAVAAAGYTYAPWLLAQAGHLHIISNGGIPLALAMLARGHGFSFRHGYRPERRHAGWALAGWLVAAWQLSLGFGIGLVFAYVLALLGVGALLTWIFKRFRVWKERRPFGRKLFFADLAGGAIFVAVGGLLAIPYFEVADDHPYARRGVEEIQLYSPPLRGFFTAPPESWLWGGLHEPLRNSLGWAPEMTLLPGFALIGLALAGLFFTIWSVRQRLLLTLGIVVGAILAMGSEFQDGRYTYLPLLEHVPGWDGIRTPGRLMLWVTLLLGILAAGTVCAFVDRVKEISANRVPPWPSPWLRLVTLIPLALVLVEGINTTKHPIVPAQPAAMRTVEGPLLILPSDQLHDENAMLWSTTKFQDIVNGGSGFVPKKLEEVRQVTATFPDQNSINYLRQMGVRNVVVARDMLESGSPLLTAIELPVDSLGITREDVGSVVVYRL